MFSRTTMRFGICALCALFAVLLLAGAAGAAELVMFRRDGCSYCARWDREIGPIYPKTDVGRRVALRMLNLDRGSAASVRIHGSIHYTPTFVLVENGEEVGRIEGYAGNDFFFGLLESLVERLPPRSRERSP
jgi:hypothetical protein